MLPVETWALSRQNKKSRQSKLNSRQDNVMLFGGKKVGTLIDERTTSAAKHRELEIRHTALKMAMSERVVCHCYTTHHSECK